MGKFKKGDRVKVKFNGTITSTTEGEFVDDNGQMLNDDSCGFIEVDDARGFLHLIWISGVDDVVKSGKNPDWPPRVGDVWEADGIEYAVRQNTCQEHEIVVTPLDYRSTYKEFYEDLLSDFKKLNPTLVRRRDSK